MARDKRSLTHFEVWEDCPPWGKLRAVLCDFELWNGGRLTDDWLKVNCPDCLTIKQRNRFDKQSKAESGGKSSE